MNYTELLRLAAIASVRAGEEILKVYETNFRVEIKQDDTPVTIADKNASERIIRELAPSAVPVLSEEGVQIPYQERKNLRLLWIVDPLDGTKEFIKRNGEFSVNIALVEDGRPVLGLIYSPVFRFLYFSAKGMGAFRVSEHYMMQNFEKNGFRVSELLSVSEKLPRTPAPDTYTIIASRSHLSKEVAARITAARYRFNGVDVINTGSSIKFCRVAEGLAHEYPRYGNTMEWDTAAGQCILEESGGSLIDLATSEPMVYNREELRNNNFIAFGAEAEIRL